MAEPQPLVEPGVHLNALQDLIDTGAARSLTSLTEQMERRPIRIPQLVDTLHTVLDEFNVSLTSIRSKLYRPYRFKFRFVRPIFVLVPSNSVTMCSRLVAFMGT